jgi:hypothetical protein
LADFLSLSRNAKNKSGEIYNFHDFGASEEGYCRDFFAVIMIKRHQIFWKVVKDIIL